MESKFETSNILNLSSTSNTMVSKKGVEDHATDQLDSYMMKSAKENKLLGTGSSAKSSDRQRVIKISDRETSEFLNYLDTFQKENEKLKRETEDLLKRSAKIQGIKK